MNATAVVRWALLWRSKNRLDGASEHLIFDGGLPALFVTRRDARAFARKHYGYITKRPDLRTEPHGWRLPQLVRVVIQVLTQ